MNQGIKTVLFGVFIIVAAIGVLVFMGISTSGYEKISADVTAVELNPAFVPNDENSADSEYTVTLSYTKEIDAR